MRCPFLPRRSREILPRSSKGRILSAQLAGVSPPGKCAWMGPSYGGVVTAHALHEDGQVVGPALEPVPRAGIQRYSTAGAMALVARTSTGRGFAAGPGSAGRCRSGRWWFREAGLQQKRRRAAGCARADAEQLGLAEPVPRRGWRLDRHRWNGLIRSLIRSVSARGCRRRCARTARPGKGWVNSRTLRLVRRAMAG